MLRIFIDANIYLGLFGVVDVKVLLAPLKDLLPHIFITQQIVDEIERNKVEAAKSFLDEQTIKMTARISTPQLLLQHTRRSDRTLILRSSKRQENLRNAVRNALEETLVAVAESRDYVSKALRPLYRKAKKASPEEMQRARLRKEIGNPPGKRADPLGDQISWEQLLGNVEPTDEVWVVTKDGDFRTVHNKSSILNPVLRRDIAFATNVTPRAFDTLSDVAVAYKKRNPSGSPHVPASRVLEGTRKQEQTAQLFSLSEDSGAMATASFLNRVAAAYKTTPQQAVAWYVGDSSIASLPQLDKMYVATKFDPLFDTTLSKQGDASNSPPKGKAPPKTKPK